MPLVPRDARHAPLYARLPVVEVGDDEWPLVTRAFLDARWAEVRARAAAGGYYDVRAVYRPFWLAQLATHLRPPPPPPT